MQTIQVQELSERAERSELALEEVKHRVEDLQFQHNRDLEQMEHRDGDTAELRQRLAEAQEQLKLRDKASPTCTSPTPLDTSPENTVGISKALFSFKCICI